jgi:outer membrane lipoprotein-sorting protein
MKHSRIFCILILAFFPLVTFAQDKAKEAIKAKEEREAKNAKEAKDPKAMALLDKAVAAFDSKKGIMADFVITLENTRDDKKEEIPGKIWLKEERFKLAIKDVDTYFDGKTQSVYMKEAQEVTVSSPSAEELKDINPVMLLKSYREGYKMKFVETAQEGGKTLDVIDLYPEDLKNANLRITVSIEKESMRLHSVRMQGKDGVNTILEIKKYDHKPISDDVFTFNPNDIKGIEVIDLR